MSFLLDTCCISEFTKKKTNEGVLDWLNVNDQEFMFLSVLTLGEIQKGISLLSDSPRKKQIQNWLLKDLPHQFDGKIIDIDFHVCQVWGELQAKAKSENFTLPAIDGLLAATAITYDLSMVTRKGKDFDRINVEVVNPWSNQSR
ncbi:MAG: type II toxin-antitoxin system VapC family toxin [Balneolales bacterium]